MSTWQIIIRILILLSCAANVRPLTCLKCSNVPKPRLCKTVTECDTGQVCGTEKVRNSFGEEVYNLGCLATSECTGSDAGCVECCNSSLCNARGCGQEGYPPNHDRICYNCPLYTDSIPCHSIDFCSTAEVCMFETKKVFGDLVYSSRCAEAYFCKQHLFGGVTLVGRDLERQSDDLQITETQRNVPCYGCCSQDLCNQQCNTTDTNPTPAVSFCQPNPCHLGQCIDISVDFVCNCENGYTGKTCEQAFSANYCTLSSCAHGTCYNVSDGFICKCDHGYEGKLCNISIYACVSNPCVNGRCIDEQNSYTCICDQWFEGTHCEKPISHCRSSPCHHGTCYDITDDFVCICDHGYEGKHCANSSFVCDTNPCSYGNCKNVQDDYICQCDTGHYGKNCDKPTDCFDIIRNNPNAGSGIYNITLWKSHRKHQVFCDMTTDGGGWTVFQSRFNGSVDFNRTYSEYEHGFGSLYREFWLGLSIVQEMAAQNKTELRLDLTAANGSTAFEVFQNFRLDNLNYTLHIDRGTGTAGDTDSYGLSYLNGHGFATYDRPDPNRCATSYQGWWFNNCFYVNLNGRYVTPGTDNFQGIIYYAFQSYKSLKVSQMKFRRNV